MDDNVRQEYERWLARADADADVTEELRRMAGDESRISDAFYRDLAFGTGGLRGVIGAGTNRMNFYTVAKASQGLANYVLSNFAEEERRIAVSFDSRIKSGLFSQVAAGVFAANGIHVYIYPVLMPTPCLSYAVRELRCAAGIMVTASHNPSKYNGYKVYGSDGCQITTESASAIYAEIEKLDIFEDVKQVDFEAGVESGAIEYIGGDVCTSFIEAVKQQSMLKIGDLVDRDVAIVYSPLNGTGLVPVTRILRESGFTNITVVKEQEEPDGHFPTCPYPNPEIREAMELGMRYAKERRADLLLATDPDCDRVGIAVRNEEGEFVLLTGNETGMLLLNYICERRTANGTMPDDPVVVKTIVTIDMAERIAAHYGVRTINVLTGFKFIGEQIGLLERAGKEDSYIFGFEESYGYLSGGYVRDKDAVDGAFLICEMFAYYKTRGVSLLQKLDELYREYGYTLNTLHSYEFEGAAGFEKMQGVMRALRGGDAAAAAAVTSGSGADDSSGGTPAASAEIAITGFGGRKVEKLLDYAEGIDGLPKSDVLKFLLDGNCSVVVRPSGTEPKLKLYVSVSAESREAAVAAERSLAADVEHYLC